METKAAITPTETNPAPAALEPPKKVFRCGLCSVSFPKKEKLLRHLRAIHWGLKHRCPKCNSQFADKLKLNVHLELKHGLYFCKDCREICLNASHDCLAKKRKIFRCDLGDCEGKVFKLYSFYLNHLEKVHHVKREDGIERELEKDKRIEIEEKEKRIKMEEATRASSSNNDRLGSGGEMTPVKMTTRARSGRVRTVPNSPYQYVS
jgi:hypothetical protein